MLILPSLSILIFVFGLPLLQDHLIAESESVRTHAEMAVSEMEAAAQQQLQSIANQSETTIKLLNHKLEKLKGKNEEFHIFVKV